MSAGLAQRLATFVIMTIKMMTSRRCIKVLILIWCAAIVLRFLQLHATILETNSSSTSSRSSLFDIQTDQQQDSDLQSYRVSYGVSLSCSK